MVLLLMQNNGRDGRLVIVMMLLLLLHFQFVSFVRFAEFVLHLLVVVDYVGLLVVVMMM